MNSIKLSDADSRAKLAKIITKLFWHWGLPEEDQLILLGYSSRSKKSLHRLQTGSPLVNRREVLERVALLLSIHKALRLLYPHNLELVYGWPSLKNEIFSGDTPLDVMKQGNMGLRSVEAYLNYQLML